MANSLETAALLLKETTAIRKKNEEQYRKSGEMYNIFKAADISEKEVPMCNVIVDLLNPEGSHYQKDMYLKLFMSMVVRQHINKEVKLDLSKAKVKNRA